MKHKKVEVNVGNHAYDVLVPQLESVSEFVTELCDGDEELALETLNNVIKHSAINNGRSKVAIAAADGKKADVEAAIESHKRLAKGYKPGRKGRGSKYALSYKQRLEFSRIIGEIVASGRQPTQAEYRDAWREAEELEPEEKAA